MNKYGFRADRRVGMWNPIYFEPMVTMIRHVISLFS